MKIPAFLSLLLLPCVAGAAEGAGAPGFSFAAGFMQMLAALAIVVGVIYLAFYLFNRILRGNLVKTSVPRYIRVVESRFITPKKSLLLVEVGGEYLLLGSTDSGLDLIKQIDMLESIEVVEELSAAARSSDSFRTGARSFYDMLQKKLNGSIPLGKKAV